LVIFLSTQTMLDRLVGRQLKNLALTSLTADRSVD